MIGEAELLGQAEHAMAVRGIGAHAGRVVQQGLDEEGARPVRTAGGLQGLEVRTVGTARHRDQAHVVGAQLFEEHEVARVFHQHRIPGGKQDPRQQIEGLRGADRW